MTEIAPHGFKEIRLEATHLEELREFYGSNLGLTVARDGEGLGVTLGSTDLSFKSVEKPSIYHFAFNIPENKLEESQDWLRNRTVELVEQNGSPTFHFANWNAHGTYFFDPAGNIVEFIARHTLPNSSTSRFDSQSILYASELGLVVDDVPRTVDKIGRDLGMKPYKGASDQFTAVGDEHALLIVVKRGRVWFGSSDQPAAVHPAEAHIAGIKGKFMVDPYRVSG
jgi:catechol-2,3-dioxygenase